MMLTWKIRQQFSSTWSRTSSVQFNMIQDQFYTLGVIFVVVAVSFISRMLYSTSSLLPVYACRLPCSSSVVLVFVYGSGHKATIQESKQHLILCSDSELCSSLLFFSAAISALYSIGCSYWALLGRSLKSSIHEATSHQNGSIFVQ